jgi:adenylylsulfate kinase-like enzyme
LHFRGLVMDSPSAPPKGIYRRALEGLGADVPGVQAPYEPPVAPDVIVRGDHESPAAAAQRVIAKLLEKGFITT